MLQLVIKSDLKFSKPRTEEFFSLLVCVKWPGVLDWKGSQKIGKLE